MTSTTKQMDPKRKGVERPGMKLQNTAYLMLDMCGQPTFMTVKLDAETSR